jgi:hypothetical protein
MKAALEDWGAGSKPCPKCGRPMKLLSDAAARSGERCVAAAAGAVKEEISVSWSARRKARNGLLSYTR